MATYYEVMNLLEKAYKDLNEPTSNQQGMPAHLRCVAADFAKARALIKKLERTAKRRAKVWEDELFWEKE